MAGWKGRLWREEEMEMREVMMKGRKEGTKEGGALHMIRSNKRSENSHQMQPLNKYSACN